MIKKVREFTLPAPYTQIRYCPVNMGKDRERAWAFIHSNTSDMNPWEETIYFPTDTLKITLMSDSGEVLWTKDLGPGTVPGTDFEPVISFDLNNDGVDEIWYLNNTHPERPLTMESRVLECMDPITQEVLGQWPWPTYTANQRLAHAYRFYLICGYAHGEPILVCAQGTYEDEYLQGWSWGAKGVQKRWDIKLAKEDKKARANHHTTVFDINNDGVDELFYGERVISLADGHEVYCGDPGKFWAHSDVLSIIEDPDDGKLYIFTAREGQYDPENFADRVVMYDDHMNSVWRCSEGTHMHLGWVAAIGENRNYVCMAAQLLGEGKGSHAGAKRFFYFDAKTGKQLPPPLPYDGEKYLWPLDINGDGYDEFIVENDVVDRFNNKIGSFDGRIYTVGHILPELPAMQILALDRPNQKVYIFADDEAINKPDKYAAYHRNMQSMMACSSNRHNGVFGI